MNEVLSGLIGNCVMVYIDDVIIYSKTFKDHLRHLQEVFYRLEEAGLKLKPSKCQFFRKEILYLGRGNTERIIS